MSYTQRLDAARKFGGMSTPYNDPSAHLRGVYANFPASYPKYSLQNTVQGSLETAFRLYLPARYLLKANPQDKDILKPLVNNQYINLAVLQVQEQFSEKMEVKQLVNGAFATYFYGISPPQFTFSGVVPNDFQDDWRNQLLRLYSRYLRGSMLAKAGKQVIVTYSDMIATGECIGLSTSLTGQSETHGNFNLSMIVHKLVVKKSPLVSDFVTKDTQPLTQENNTVLISSKKIKAAIRSASASDIVTQGDMTPAERNKRLALLEQKKNNLKALEVTVQTRLSTAQVQYNNYQQTNSGNPFDAEGLRRQSEVRAAENDLETVRRQVSEVEKKQKEVREGSARRNSNQRKRSTSSPTPDRVIELPAKLIPPVNRKITQATA